MLKILKTNLKHFFITFTILFVLLAAFGIYHGAEAHLDDDPRAFKLDKEGPHIFFEDDKVVINYIRGGKPDGFYTDKASHPVDSRIPVKAHFTLEEQDIEFSVNPTIETPAAVYEDNNPILAI